MKNWGTKTQPYYHLGANFTADVVVIWRDQVLLIKRGRDPFYGSWALPGGFHETSAPYGEPWRPGLETAKEAALRELEEETAVSRELVLDYIYPLAIFDKFGRDPRDNPLAWAVSQVFVVRIPSELEISISHGDDADQARWFSREQIETISLAFDHRQMLEKSGFV